MGFGEIQKVKGYDQISVDKLPTFIGSPTSSCEKSFSFCIEDSPEDFYTVVPSINEELGLTEIASTT